MSQVGRVLSHPPKERDILGYTPIYGWIFNWITIFSFPSTLNIPASRKHPLIYNVRSRVSLPFPTKKKKGNETLNRTGWTDHVSSFYFLFCCYLFSYVLWISALKFQHTFRACFSPAPHIQRRRRGLSGFLPPSLASQACPKHSVRKEWLNLRQTYRNSCYAAQYNFFSFVRRQSLLDGMETKFIYIFICMWGRPPETLFNGFRSSFHLCANLMPASFPCPIVHHFKHVF